MRTGKLDIPIVIDGTWSVVYDSGNIGTATNEVIASGLDGDIDEVYQIITRLVSESTGTSSYYIQPNSDSGDNYGQQDLQGADSTLTSSRSTGYGSGLNIGKAISGEVNMSNSIFYAKSGKVRTSIDKSAVAISGTTVTEIHLDGHSWNNTATNVTSLRFYSSQANGIGVGSRIVILKRNKLTSGIKGGELNPQGDIYGNWQLVQNYNIASVVTTSETSADGAYYGAYESVADGMAIQFKVAQSGVIRSFVHKLYRAGGATGTYNAYIYSSVANVPSALLATFSTLDISTITTDTGGVEYTFTGEFTPTPDTFYYCVLIASGGFTGQVYHIKNTTAQTNGQMYRRYPGTWAGGYLGECGYFKVNQNGPQTSLSFSNLDGNTDCFYRIVNRVVANANTGVNIRLNGDTGNNYGNQIMDGYSSNTEAQRATGQTSLSMGSASASGNTSFSEVLLFAKSGKVRTWLNDIVADVSGTTIYQRIISGSVWNNTADNITSIDIFGTTNGLGVGSHFELWRLNL